METRQIKYKVDGYFEWAGRKYICEYNGCNFHGCMTCYPRDREATVIMTNLWPKYMEKQC